MKKSIKVLFFLLLVVSATSIMGETLVVYSNFALISSNKVQRRDGFLIIPTTNFTIQNSLSTSLPIKSYRYHKGEACSLQAFLNAYVGKLVEFKFQDGSVKTLKLLSARPQILQNPHTGNVYFSPVGEYIFPSPILTDEKNYFVVSTNATQLSYNYISTNIGWNAFYTLSMNSSTLDAKLLLWNETDTEFKNFHLFFVAGKQFEEFRKSGIYPKSLAIRSPQTLENSSFNSYEGYKVYNFGTVKTLDANSKVYLSLFSKKVNVEKINVAYNPSQNFTKVSQAVRIKHEFDLPAGTISIYDEKDGISYYLGQAKVQDSPASSVLEIPYGENFNVEVKNVKVRHSIVSKESFVDYYKFYVVNHSNKEESVWIYEYVPQSSEVMSKTLNIQRISANEIRFYVKARANSEENFDYEVRASY